MTTFPPIQAAAPINPLQSVLLLIFSLAVGSHVSGGGFSEAVQDQQGNEAERGYPEEKRRSRKV